MDSLYQIGNKIHIETPEDALAQHNKDWDENKYKIYEQLQPYFTAADTANQLFSTLYKGGSGTKKIGGEQGLAFGGKNSLSHVKLTNGEVVLLPDGSDALVKGGNPNDPKADDVSATLPKGSFVLPKALRLNGKSFADIFLKGKQAEEQAIKNKVDDKELERIKQANQKTVEQLKSLTVDYNLSKGVEEMITQGFWGGGLIGEDEWWNTKNGVKPIDPTDILLKDFNEDKNVVAPNSFSLAGKGFTPTQPTTASNPILPDYLKKDANLTPSYSLEGEGYEPSIEETIASDADATAKAQYDKTTNAGVIPEIGSPEVEGQKGSSYDFSSLKSNLTTGDYLGLAGSIYGTMFPLKDALANAASTDIAVDQYKNYGQDALDSLEQQKDFIGEQYDKAQMDIAQSEQSFAKQLRDSSRGSGNYAANRVAGLEAGMDQKADVRNMFANQMMQYFQQKQALTQNIDQVKAGSRAATVDANAQNKDINAANISKAKESTALGLQSIGKSLNANKYRTDSLNLLDEIQTLGLDKNYSIAATLSIQSALRKQYTPDAWENLTKEEKTAAIEKLEKKK